MQKRGIIEIPDLAHDNKCHCKNFIAVLVRQNFTTVIMIETKLRHCQPLSYGLNINVRISISKYLVDGYKKDCFSLVKIAMSLGVMQTFMDISKQCFYSFAFEIS